MEHVRHGSVRRPQWPGTRIGAPGARWPAGWLSPVPVAEVEVTLFGHGFAERID